MMLQGPPGMCGTSSYPCPLQPHPGRCHATALVVNTASTQNARWTYVMNPIIACRGQRSPAPGPCHTDNAEYRPGASNEHTASLSSIEHAGHGALSPKCFAWNTKPKVICMACYTIDTSVRPLCCNDIVSPQIRPSLAY